MSFAFDILLSDFTFNTIYQIQSFFICSTAVVAELGQQRESLLRTRQRVTDTNQELSRARSTLRKMSYQVATNKILLILIIITEVAILAALLYMRLRKKI